MPSEDIEQAVPVAERLRDPFERLWKEKADEPLPEYRLLIWGSTIKDGQTPTDLDIIIEYTGQSISPDVENTIERNLHDSVTKTENFSYVDPVVVHYIETPTVVSGSRNERLYSIDEQGWLEF